MTFHVAGSYHINRGIRQARELLLQHRALLLVKVLERQLPRAPLLLAGVSTGQRRNALGVPQQPPR